MPSKAWILIVLVPALLAAQPAWENLRHIQPGRKVEVRQTGGQKISARFQSASETAVTVQAGRETRSIPRAEVASVSLLIGKSRGAKAAIAGGITGGTLGAVFGGYCAARGDCVASSGGPVVIALFAAVAGGIAALFPPHREVVYSANPGGK